MLPGALDLSPQMREAGALLGLVEGCGQCAEFQVYVCQTARNVVHVVPYPVAGKHLGYLLRSPGDLRPPDQSPAAGLAQSRGGDSR